MLDIIVREVKFLEGHLGNAHIVAQPLDGFQGLVRGLDRIHVVDVEPHGLADLLELFRYGDGIEALHGQHHDGIGVTVVPNP